MTPNPSKALYEAAGKDTEQKILEAAAILFAERGFRAATMRGIADVARINEVTIYRYFPNKQSLCWRAVDAKLRQVSFTENLVRPISEDKRPLESLQHLSLAAIEVMQREPCLARLLYFTGLELGRERRMIYNAHLKPIIQALGIRLGAWIQGGEIRAVDTETTAISILSVILSRLHLTELFGQVVSQQKTSEELAREYSNFCISGILLNSAVTRS